MDPMGYSYLVRVIGRFPHGKETMGSWSPSLQMEEKWGPISKMAENQWVNKVLVDLSLNQAAKPWFHQYLDPAWYHLWPATLVDGAISPLGLEVLTPLITGFPGPIL